MSYLDPLRLHFAGKFQAAISTVNNDPLHYDTANFKPQYQERQTGNDPDQLNGWFNPRGSGDWRLIECTITSAWLADGTEAAEDDPILSAIIADSDRLAPAKLVDIDPEQQLVSTIWGMEVRIATPAGENFLRSHFAPAAFMDIWDRTPGLGDASAGAMYQSVLTNLEWGEVGPSPFLTGLREASGNGLLSIKFNVDGINLAFTSPDFTIGRIVGTIGPTAADEPHHFVAGRQFMTSPKAGTSGHGHFFTPANGINFCAGVINRNTKRVYLDLGNALPTATSGGPPVDLGDITLFQAPPPLPTQQPLAIGQITATSYTNPDWYRKTAGVIVLPSDRSLTEAELDRIENNPLVIAITPAESPPGVVISEPPLGVFVRADQFVFRLNPHEEVSVRLCATRFGRPYAHAPIVTLRYSDQLQPFSPLGEAPMVATPDVIEFPVRTITDDHGIATLAVRAADPGTPRNYLDGQLYGLYPVLEETIVSPGNPYPFNQWAFVTLLVWSGFEPEDPPTWFGTVHPILQQYANLYPVMGRFLDLGDYDSVCDNLRLLELSFALDVDHPNSMPVTRDLSAAKRAAILRWLRERGDDGKPRKGTPPRPESVSAATRREPSSRGLEPVPSSLRVPPQQGGKASAASRRLVVNGSKAGVAAVDLTEVKP